LTLSLRARLLLAFGLVAVPPVAMLAASAYSLISRSLEENARRRLRETLGSARGRIDELRREAEAQLAGVARDDLAQPPASPAEDRTAASAVAARRGLETFEIITDTGRVVSSHHWPAGFDLPEQGETVAQDPPLRLVAVAEGFGSVQRLALMPSRSARWRGAPVTLRGGPLLDAAFLGSLGRLMGVEAAFYDAARRRWVSPADSRLGRWSGPAFAAPEAEGVAGLDGVAHRWAATRLAENFWLVVSAPRTLEAALSERFLRLTLLASLAALAAALGGAFVLSRRIARPVRELADGARRIAAGQRPGAVSAAAGDEIGELAAAFNAMGEDLDASRARLVQVERVAAWREMARRLAHELKNPLFPIQLSIETLRRAADQEGGQAGGESGFARLFRESSDTILDELRALRRIVDEFSEFARLPRPRFVPTDLNELVGQTLALYKARAGEVDFETALDPLLPLVPVDRDLLARALGNLVANALDAMPDGGRLLLRTALAAGEVRLCVEDSGPGLDLEQQRRLFTPYLTTKRGGTGLGLAIVQGIATDHGGRVEVRSEPGHGSGFTLVLPAPRPPA
jgi:nitrogen fixation/metabolism regulation signal transduction histidine kinase